MDYPESQDVDHLQCFSVKYGLNINLRMNVSLIAPNRFSPFPNLCNFAAENKSNGQ